MKTFPWASLLAWALAAFFVLGGTLNIMASAEIRADYARWGYPAGFNIVTGVLEWTAAVLLVLGRTRLWGAGLGMAVMAAAIATVVWNGEPDHAVPPLVVLGFCAIIALATVKQRTARGFRPDK